MDVLVEGGPVVDEDGPAVVDEVVVRVTVVDEVVVSAIVDGAVVVVSEVDVVEPATVATVVAVHEAVVVDAIVVGERGQAD